MCNLYKNHNEIQYLFAKRVIFQIKLNLCHRGKSGSSADIKFYQSQNEICSTEESKTCFKCKRIIEEELFLIKL